MESTTEKKRWPLEFVLPIANMILGELAPFCRRSIVAGSIRRRKSTVGDIEILMIPRLIERKADMFSTETIPAVDETIQRLIETKLLRKRLNSRGSEMFGPKNKLLAHIPTAIPVDLFSTTDEAWHNYLVCRTGPMESNVRIATLAQKRGWKWNPYGSGFSRGGPLAGEREERIMNSEEEVFQFVGLAYQPPEKRR